MYNNKVLFNLFSNSFGPFINNSVQKNLSGITIKYTIQTGTYGRDSELPVSFSTHPLSQLYFHSSETRAIRFEGLFIYFSFVSRDKRRE